MFLKRIELEGFKSFADRSVIHFDDDVVGIVGPIGCGKSNINDAIRWVLGEQSVKSLRGNSMSDVIFNGSMDRRKVNTASVTLVFDNSQHLLHIDYDEVEITRKLHRQNGEAEYYINKAPCRLKDITSLVMDTGLGKDSLSIISQGNISSFADSKPEERRALFEEAAGVAKYKKRKNESLNKLNRTEDNLSRLEDIIMELEKQLTPLKRQAAKAKIYIEKKEALEEIEVSVLADEITSLKEQISQLQRDAFTLEADKAAIEAQISVKDIQTASLREEMYVLDREITKLQESFTKAQEEVRVLDARKIEMEEKRKYALEHGSLPLRIEELKKMLEEARFEYEDRLKRKNELSQKIHEKRLLIEDLKKKEEHQKQELMQEQGYLQRLMNREELLSNMMKRPFQHQHALQSVLDADLNGIYDAIANVFTPQAQYEQAISNALGGSMYHIIAHDEASARHAIQFLKRNRAGRATFLPLNIMKPREVFPEHHLMLAKLDGFLGVANQFVTCDDKFEVIRDNLLGNVLIADTLVHANDIGRAMRYRYKIVTLDGDVVNVGGSMSGGSQKNQSSIMTMQREHQEVSSQLEGQQMKCNLYTKQLHDLTQKLTSHENELVEWKVAYASLEQITSVKKLKADRIYDELQELSPDALEDVSSETQDDVIVQLSEKHRQIDEITMEMKARRERRYKAGNQVEQADRSIRGLRRDLNQKANELRDIEIAVAKAETNLTNTLDRLSSTYEMTYEYALEKRRDIDVVLAREQVKTLRHEIQALGHVNLEAPQEYEEVKGRFDFLSSQKAELEEARRKILNAIDEMDEIMIKQFSEMFEKINNELQDVFTALFGGGKARLFLVDPNDILNTGIDIDVQPPGKNVANIRLFSGGEKSLIAICVLFAILKARTIPLCIFDEVEAALDQVNVERFAKYIQQFRGESQFIVVTHRPGTMAQCDTLYGVTMQKNGVSSLLKVKLSDAIHMIDGEKEN